MSLVQQYKGILDRLYTATLPRREDEDLRSQLAEIWFRLNDEEQDQVQNHSVAIRRARR